MTTLMESCARLHRADPEALRIVMKSLRRAATPTGEDGQYAYAVGRVEGTLIAMESAVEWEDAPKGCDRASGVTPPWLPMTSGSRAW